MAFQMVDEDPLCPFCGGRYERVEGVIGRALDDAAEGQYVMVDLKPNNVVALQCQSCGMVMYKDKETRDG